MHTGNAAIVIGLALFTAAVGIPFTDWATNKPAERRMSLVALEYKDGKVGQNLLVVADKPIPAVWSAAILRDGHPICSGRGTFPYEPRDGNVWKWMTPSAWTGGKCPPLQKKDILRAVWEWRTVYGWVDTTSGTIEVMD